MNRAVFLGAVNAGILLLVFEIELKIRWSGTSGYRVSL
jgi:hypothetical protein